MKMFISLIFLIQTTAWASDIKGVWKYDGYVYNGSIFPVQSGVDLRFRFDSEGVSTLRWYYDNDDSFCERKASYQILEENWLYQKITWVNPKNHISCSSDSDMQLGKESYTKFEFKDERLLLKLELSGNELIYILNKVFIKY